MKYTLVFQKRKSIAMKILEDGTLQVCAPRGCPKAEIERCIEKHAAKLEQMRQSVMESGAQKRSNLDKPPRTIRILGQDVPLEAMTERRVRFDLEAMRFGVPPDLTLRQLMPTLETCYRKEAKSYLAHRLLVWACKMGLAPAKLTITGATTRWGSCSSRDSICFSWRLMMASPRAIDSVVVHELTHMKELNHSPRFYALLRETFPEYDEAKAELDALTHELRRTGWMDK